MDNEQILDEQNSINLNNQDNNHQLDKKESKKNTIMIIIAIVIILLSLLAIGYFYLQSEKDNDTNSSVKNNTNDSIKNTTNNIVNNTTNNNTEETNNYKVSKWNNSVAYIPSKSFYKNPSEDLTYTNVATLKSGKVVVRAAEWLSEDYFLVDTKGNITFLAKYSGTGEMFPKDSLISDIKIDKNITIPDVFPEDDITYKGQILKFQRHVFKEKEDIPFGVKVTRLQSTTSGNLYEYYYLVSDDLYVQEFYIKTPDPKETHYYELMNVDIYNDDRTIKVNWNDDSYKTITWGMPISECGNNGSRLYIKNYDISMGTEIGTITVNNRPIYRLTDDDLMTTFYNEYYTEGADNLSFEEYKAKLATVVYQDDLGGWIALQNDQYSHSAECGKPVIYLYPKEDSYINVKVGANVTVSDPTYNNGWMNVLAKPNGMLTYQGKEYDSLFWEGTGFGKYPNVSKIGKVVTQDKLLSTIKLDLKDQGLNQKEIVDFIEFWDDHLPKTPYVKLTWFTTEQMNNLAPLKVTPRPDTVIRVFLDAKGLDKSVQLTPQTLTKVDRKGFTLVEWGGLLKK